MAAAAWDVEGVYISVEKCLAVLRNRAEPQSLAIKLSDLHDFAGNFSSGVWVVVT